MDRLSELREKAIGLVDKIPWQYIADSPTAKYYTNWKLFEKALEEAGGGHTGGRQGLLFASHETLLGCGGVGAREAPGLNVYKYHEAPGEYKSLLGSLLDPSEGRLAAIHYTRLENAYIIMVREPGVYRVGVCGRGGSWSSSHIVVATVPGVDASLILDIALESNGTLALEVYAGENTRLELLTVSRPVEGVTVALLSRRFLSQGARIVSASLHKASLMYRVEEKTVLSTGAQYDHQGVAVAGRNARIDYILDTLHQAPKSGSIVNAYGFALDNGFTVVRGLSSISSSAKGSSTTLVTEVLMLGDEAKGYTMPLLEINTGDVEAASHRAAQYRVSRSLLFYLQSRGLSPEDAIGLLSVGRIVSALARLETAYKSMGGDVEKIVEALFKQ